MFDGTVALSSGEARFEVIGDDRTLEVRFDRLADLRAAWRSSRWARRWIGSYRDNPAFPVRVTLRGRTLAETGPGPRPLWTLPGLAGRVLGLPLTRLSPSVLLGR